MAVCMKHWNVKYWFLEQIMFALQFSPAGLFFLLVVQPQCSLQARNKCWRIAMLKEAKANECVFKRVCVYLWLRYFRLGCVVLNMFSLFLPLPCFCFTASPNDSSKCSKKKVWHTFDAHTCMLTNSTLYTSKPSPQQKKNWKNKPDDEKYTSQTCCFHQTFPRTG